MSNILVNVVLFFVSSVESRVEKEIHKHVGVLCDFVKKLTSDTSLNLLPALLSNSIYKQQM